MLKFKQEEIVSREQEVKDFQNQEESCFTIGDHCSHKGCNQLDFLPIKCSACNQKFCSSHYKFADHACAKASPEQLDSGNQYQIPVCPLCDKTVPFLDGKRDANAAIDRHISLGCDSKKSAKPKIYKNRCNKKGCKKKEAHGFKCAVCKLSFCIKHRFETDHECRGVMAMREVERMKRLQRFDPGFLQSFSKSVTVK